MRSKVVPQLGRVLAIAVLLLVCHTTDSLAKANALDPDVGRSVTEIVEARGYTVETHKVTTSDRYVLTMYRLPKTYDESQAGSDAAANKPVVLLQHGLLDSSFTWVLNFRNQSMAYVLADAGYDVWLGNNRGNTWSNEHLDYTTEDDEYWDFTWEDMGKFDLPAQIEFALETTGQPTLSYVGHSEGTTQAFVGFSANQEIAQKVSYFGALAPVAWTGHATATLFVTLARLHVDLSLRAVGISHFFLQNDLLQDVVAGYTCTVDDVLCSTALSLIAGESDNLNASRLAVYISQTPVGTSVKNVAHYAQGIRDGTFAAFDYGCGCSRYLPIGLCSKAVCENKARYGAFDPPVFPVGDMLYPRTGFFSGAKDTFATWMDIAHLRSVLPVGTLVYDKEVTEFGHYDFTWAFNAYNVYEDLLEQIAKFNGLGYALDPVQ